MRTETTNSTLLLSKILLSTVKHASNTLLLSKFLISKVTQIYVIEFMGLIKCLITKLKLMNWTKNWNAQYLNGKID